MKRQPWIVLVAGLCFLLTGVASPSAAEKVLFCFDWVPYGKHTPYIVARDKGFFKEEGIDVTMQRGHGSGDTTKRVGVQDCAYGMASFGPQALGMNKGLPIKVFGILEHKFQEIIYFFSDSGIKTPKDLEGKRLTGGPKSSADYLMFPVFAKANGIDLSKIQWVFMEPGLKPSSLGAGRVDAAVDYHTQLPRWQKVAKELGKELKYMLWADQGIDLYSAALVTHKSNLTGANSDRTRRVTRSIYRGIAWTLKHPTEAINIFLKSYPEQSFQSAKETLDIFMEHLFDGLSEKQGIGHADLAKMERTIRITLEASGEPVKIKAEDAFTNEYVDALPREVRFMRPTS